jgi:uncharacterized Fe-S cluster protein YjdI
MKVKTYEKDDIAVVWEPGKCQHSGNCSNGLSSVFKYDERPWIQVDGATKEEIIAQVAKCPSGALSIKYLSDEE